MASILDDRDNVGAGFGNVDKITAGPVGEFHGVDRTARADDVGHVRDGGTSGSTKVQNLRSGLDPDVVNTTKNSSSDWGAKKKRRKTCERDLKKKT